ncbi:uncharacterized protein NEMAJ01_0978 [Nematocida major]|uniref:uncharacterized protein n=1 Tax=Nematocida major TaxID=1912982 RepID=UPI00200720C7|nr:uncharacterized protein NEMAJ01_0978 [Nematocida major]KAH9386082.1 hypothetical protein NEMAJ01_0978 [Nematocida major]
MKPCSLLLQTLQKHKLLGEPLREFKVKEETKECVYAALKTELFFQNIEECESRGVLMCYDELVEYSLPAVSSEIKISDEEIYYMEKTLKSVFRHALHSFYLAKSGDKLYLHIKYAEEPSTLIVGPVVQSGKTAETDTEAAEFMGLWEGLIEHRMFEDGKIRVCAHFKDCKPDTMRYEMLCRIFSIKTQESKKAASKKAASEKAASEKAGCKRPARILTPTIALESVDLGYQGSNRKKSHLSINSSLDAIRESFPVTIIESVYTGPYSRMTRAIAEQRSQVYLKVGRGHIWPKHDARLSDASITALNGVLGKSLERHTTIEGISKDNTVYSTLFGERFEFIFDVEGEQSIHPEKYHLMNFRVEYERFFQEASSRQKGFPRLCALVKNLLHAHGLYPHYISDVAVEIFCYRTGYSANTLSGGLRAVMSTQYSYGYALDIRRGKCKIRPKKTGKIEITHSAGAYTIDLPPESMHNEMNQIFKSSLQMTENIPGITESREVSSVFRGLFVPSTNGVAFSLSSVPLRDYTEIAHYTAHLGGAHTRTDEAHCFSTLIDMGCTPYFCRSGILHVRMSDQSSAKLAIGAAVLLTGMKYIKVRTHEHTHK